MWKRLSALYGLLRKDLRILWVALRHPERPVWLIPALALLGLYVLSPLDLIPEALPIVGLIDDLLLLPLAIGWLIRLLPDPIKQATAGHRRSAYPTQTTRATPAKRR